MRGIIVKYNKEKGYGFIRSDQTDKDIYFHISNIENDRNISRKQEVEFKLKNNKKGPFAVSIIPGEKQIEPLRFFIGMIIIVLIVTMTILKIILSETSLFSIYFIAVSLTTFFIYSYDKDASQSDKLRVPEKVMHGLEFALGAPAALVSQKLFRHKTIKKSYQSRFRTILLLQFILLIWYFV